MIPARAVAVLAAAALAAGCSSSDVAQRNSLQPEDAATPGPVSSDDPTPMATIALTVDGADGPHGFTVEVAKTPFQQERGLMFRPSIPEDGGMLFWPYPADGSPPRVANFWMKNTPSSLDIIYIRPDHTIARIAENAVPNSETPISSGEPVGAVLELRGGRSAELGIDEEDKVTWAGQQ